MPPKVDVNGEFDVFLRVKGGGATQQQALQRRVGPYGMQAKVVSDKIADVSKDYKGIRIPIKIHSKARQIDITILPCSPALIIKGLKEPARTAAKGEHIKHNGAITFDEVTAIAKTVRFKSYSKVFAGTVCEVLGTCKSVGCGVTYQGQRYEPQDLIEKIRANEIPIENYQVPREQWKLI